jgi:phosphatidylserine decarboxylase
VFVAAFGLLGIGVALFFRDPDRLAPSDARVLVSPADGRVVEIAEGDEPVFLRQPALRVAIFMSPLDVHVNRSPCQGEVRHLEHRPGRLKSALLAEASTQNEANLIGLHNTEVGQPVLVAQIAGMVARRVFCACRVGERLDRGQRFGMVKLGSRVEVSVPAASGFRWTVRLNDRVRAGETILGGWA